MEKYQNAIHAIKANYPPEHYTLLREGLDLAIEVLEKQIPDKPYALQLAGLPKIWNHGIACICDYGKEYCPNCGQKLDWKGID